LRASFPELQAVSWLVGKLLVRPELEHTGTVIGGGPASIIPENHAFSFYVERHVVERLGPPPAVPEEITESLARFQEEFPDYERNAFIMMQFRDTAAHQGILKAIKEALKLEGMVARRADDREYNSDLFFNVLTYIYGCAFGVAILEGIEGQTFNPNVALEIGYMFALRKDVCLLKDKALKTLHADLVGKLYRPFDPQDPMGTIPVGIRKWFAEKGARSPCER
jgi:hypothetical protein